MIKLILSLSFIMSICFPIFSQESITIYLDKYRFPVERSEEATSYLVVSDDTLPKHFRVNEYYMTGGVKQIGSFSDPDLFSRIGLFRTYYPNGKIKLEENFKDNMPVGVARAWYANGRPKETGHYHKNVYKLESFYDSLGNVLVTNGHGIYTLEEADELDPDPVTLVGPVQDGLKHGMFTGYLKDGTVFCNEEYKKNKLVKGVSYDNGKNFTYRDLYDKEFSNRLLSHVKKKLRYPASARRLGTEGTVYVRVLINPDYTVKKAAIIKGISPDADAETLLVLRDTGFEYGPRLKRGQLDKGELLTIPVRFKLF